MRLAEFLGLALLLSTPASASVFRDSASGLSLRLDVPGASICYGRPESLRGEREECRGLDLGSVPGLDPAVFMFAFVRFEEWGFVLNAARAPGSPHPGPISRLEARGFIQGWVKRGPSVTAQEPDFLVINGVQVFRFVSFYKVKPAPKAFITYGLAGKSGLVVVVFVTDKEHLARVRELADAVIASVSLPHAEVPELWTVPESELPGFGVGYAVTAAALRFWLLLLLLAVPLAAALLFYRWWTGRGDTS
jgi:hypothetical protein